MRGPAKIILRNSQLKGKSHLKVIASQAWLFSSLLVTLLYVSQTSQCLTQSSMLVKLCFVSHTL